MELTLDQALQKGIEAHKAGNAQEADRYYTAILKANPKHTDANHNMGVLAVSVGKVETSLPFFKTALETNPNIVQYWLSYLDALIKLERIAVAKAVLDQAKSKGLKGDRFDRLQQRIEGAKTNEVLVAQSQEPPQEKLQSLIKLYTRGRFQKTLDESSKLLGQFSRSVILYNINGAANKGLGRLDAAIDSYNKALGIKPDFAEAYYNMANALKDQGKLEEAIEAFNNALSVKPDYADAQYNMGIVLKEQGKLEEAIEAYKQALSIKPDYAEANYNMGIALNEQGKLKEAIEAYNKALLIKPHYVEAYNNMGNALREQGNLKEAIEAFTKALSIKPDLAEVCNNMGNALQNQGKLEEALKAFNKALSIKPDHAEAYNNMGNALNEQGKLEEAIEAYNKAISFKTDYAEAWNNLYFPLQAIKTKLLMDGNLELYYPKDLNSNYAKIEQAILDFKLHRGQESNSTYLDKVISTLSNADNITIANPVSEKNAPEEIQTLTDKIVALVHFGRSGTGFMHSLIDGHPEISTLPSIYFSEFFDHSTWLRIISKGWAGMVDQFAAVFDVLFDATSPVPIRAKSRELIYNIGINDGMANVGDHKDEVIRVDKDLFKTELERLMVPYDELDAFLFFKLVHKAYDKVLNDNNHKSLIFYHAHNPDTYAQLNFVRFDPDANWILMIREPIQSCESWISRSYRENDHFGVSNRILTMLFEIDNAVYSGPNALGVRLEDLKTKPKKTIPSLCLWLGIQENESLYKMTAQGKRWWGDPNSPDYGKDGPDPFGKTSIKRKVGSIFSNRDQFIFRTLFYPFSVRFGYVNENLEQFKSDLKIIRPFLEEPFDFEKKIIEQTSSELDSFITSGSYLYLRSGLIERWNTLNKFQTYPNMIRPLKI